MKTQSAQLTIVPVCNCIELTKANEKVINFQRRLIEYLNNHGSFDDYYSLEESVVKLWHQLHATYRIAEIIYSLDGLNLHSYSHLTTTDDRVCARSYDRFQESEIAYSQVDSLVLVIQTVERLYDSVHAKVQEFAGTVVENTSQSWEIYC